MTTAKERAYAEASAVAMDRAAAIEVQQSSSLVGAVIDKFLVVERVKPGSRVLYRCRNLDTGEVVARRGYEVVRMARAARVNGLTVIMPREEWRDEARKGEMHD